MMLAGATNRPQELDEAARRRLSKRLYIPLPPHGTRIMPVNPTSHLAVGSADDSDGTFTHQDKWETFSYIQPEWNEF